MIKLFVNPSLVLPQIAATIPKKYEVKLVDDAYEDIDCDEECELVGISTATHRRLVHTKLQINLGKKEKWKEVVKTVGI